MTQHLDADMVVSAAQKLTDARLATTLIETLGEGEPSDPESAYAIAEEHASQLGRNTVGWKVGCTSTEAMEILNSPGPFAGRVFEGGVHSLGIVHEDAMHSPGLECEFAFILGTDLPPSNSEYSIDDVRAATVAVAPAIELVAPRFTDFTGIGYLSLIADSGANGGVVLGEPVAVENCPDLSNVTVDLDIDGIATKSGRGDAILGNPWEALVWIANHLSSRDIGLAEGQFVMSGTCTGIDPLPPGSVATGQYAGLGSVEISRATR